MSRAKKPVRYEFSWRDPATGDAITLRINHASNDPIDGLDHLQIEVVKPKRAPIPITETGYRSHFIGTLDLMNVGNPVTFVTAWLDREARKPEWTRQQTARQQGDLFQWAEAKKETTKRTSPRRGKLFAAKRPTAKGSVTKLRKPRGSSRTQG